MSYSKYYNPTNWENYPSEDTAINAMRLNHLEDGVDELDDRIVELSTDKSEVQWNQVLFAGQKIAEIEINGIKQDVYCSQNEGDAAAQEAALKSEGSALGKQNGSDVSPSSPYYHNNSKYYSQQASGSATSSENDALVSEGYATGKQNGQDVPSTSPYYHNNAKYYSELSDPTAFANMSDVDFNNLQNGQVPVYNSTSGKWENGSGGGGASLPIDISDNTNNVTGILKVANGGTGNSSGYVRVGQKANTTIGNYATAEGYNTTASGNDSHAEGFNTKATGLCSHAEGGGDVLSGYVTASGDYSHAEGNGTIASGLYAHAEGSSTTASGAHSHAEGNGTIASGGYSHAEGQGTIAKGTFSHTQGKYNIQDDNNTYAHIVGNGTSSARSNAHTLDWSGNAWFAGTVTDGTGNVLSNKQDALPTVVNDRYLHTNASTGALEWAQVQGGGSSATILTGTLTAGNTTITFTDNAITATALIDIYTDDPDVGWESRSVSSTTLTITFPVQASDLSVKVRIEESGV